MVQINSLETLMEVEYLYHLLNNYPAMLLSWIRLKPQQEVSIPILLILFSYYSRIMSIYSKQLLLLWLKMFTWNFALYATQWSWREGVRFMVIL